MSDTYTNVDTTAEPPLCPECHGACLVSPMGFARKCDACDGTGYERGDDASLVQMVEQLVASYDMDAWADQLRNQFQAVRETAPTR